MKEFVEQQYISESSASITAKLFARVKALRIRAIQRRALVSLSDHMLKDIGISRYDANHEIGKPFWKE